MAETTGSSAPQALVSIWKRHMAAEFEHRSADEAVSTMTPEAHVNHVPVLTGGTGQAAVRAFYAAHFIPKMPPDLELQPVSRTVGEGQLVDELVVRSTHTVEIDWMLPCVAPTGRPVEIAVVAIIGFQGDKVAHEHIYWDQASVLVQLGLIDAEALPTAGAATARKVLDPSLPSNELIARSAP